jgi:microsomal prostaglandin-E synthase 2
MHHFKAQMSFIRGSSLIPMRYQRLLTSEWWRSSRSSLVAARRQPPQPQLAPTCHSNSQCHYLSTTTGSSDSVAVPPVYLYQYKICPFSNIAKVVLTYQQIPYQSIEVNPLTKAEIKFSKDYHKVPIVRQGEGEGEHTLQFNVPTAATTTSSDASGGGGGGGDPSSGDTSFANSPSSQQWQDFARHKLAPLLYPNLCNTLSNSFRAFDYVHSEPTFTTLQKYSIQWIGSIAMYFAASKIKKKYQLEDVRLALDGGLMEVEQGLEESLASVSSSSSSSSSLPPSPFFLNNSSPGSHPQPHLGDLAVFGVLKGLEGLTILDDILHDERFPSIQQWYSVMNDEVERKRRVPVNKQE